MFWYFFFCSFSKFTTICSYFLSHRFIVYQHRCSCGAFCLGRWCNIFALFQYCFITSTQHRTVFTVINIGMVHGIQLSTHLMAIAHCCRRNSVFFFIKLYFLGSPYFIWMLDQIIAYAATAVAVFFCCCFASSLWFSITVSHWLSQCQWNSRSFVSNRRQSGDLDIASHCVNNVLFEN